jgi:hypothetical protein
MSNTDDITIGEIHRLCRRMSEQLDTMLDDVQRHDTRIAVLEDRENRGARLGGIWGALGGIVSGFLSGLVGRPS